MDQSSSPSTKAGEDELDRNNQGDSVTDVELSEKESGDPLSTSWRDEPLSSAETLKVAQILQACRDNDRQQLIALAALPGGFIEDHVRRLAWPILLGKDEREHEPVSWQQLPAHRDEDQVKLDVHRAFVYYPTGESERQIEGRKRELSGLITGLLRQHPCLCYFQGFHDIAQVLLLVLGVEKAAPLLARLSLLRIRDFMLPSISATSSHLQLLPAILYAVDPKLCRHLSGLQPYFALAATLTLYAHDIEEYGGISRLFDFLLAREAVVSVYMYATIITTRKDQLFEYDDTEPEMLYAILSKLPRPLDLESLITRTTTLFSLHPPETLPFAAWSKVSAHSVLKTTRDPRAPLASQTLDDGRLFFEKHERQIERQRALGESLERVRVVLGRYGRPAGVVTLAVFVGVVSVWLGARGSNADVSSSGAAAAAGGGGVVAVVFGAVGQKVRWVVSGLVTALRG